MRSAGILSGQQIGGSNLMSGLLAFYPAKNNPNDTSGNGLNATNVATAKLVPYTGLIGAFQIGETVECPLSGASGVVFADDGSTLTLTGVVVNFANLDAIVGDSSGATAVASGSLDDLVVFDGGQATLDGTNSLLRATGILNGLSTFTISCFLKTSLTEVSSVLLTNKDDGSSRVGFLITTGTIQGIINADSFGLIDSGIAPSGAFQSCIMTYDGATVSVYIDNGTPVTAAMTGVIVPSDKTEIGGYAAGGAPMYAGNNKLNAFHNRVVTSNERALLAGGWEPP